MAINVGEYRISLDARDPNANLNFVSHAHSDHTGAVKKNSTILCSDITRDLVQTRMKFELKTAECPPNVKFLNSGHMFGAKQLYIERESGISIVYTGDYQMQRSPVAEPIEVMAADILIIDSTYPYPDVVFEEKEEVITAMQHYIKGKEERGSILFGAYSMGKAQELIKICNEIGIAPIVDSSIARISDVYSKHGLHLDFGTRDLENGITDDDFRVPVWISNIGRMDNVKWAVSSINRRIFTAVATGFARTQRFNTDVQFALSDHADFKQAMDYISICNPKLIYTRGSGADVFAKNLKESGYNARTLEHNSNLNSLLMNYI